MFDALSDRLERISTRLRGKGRISDADLDEALKEIRTALLDADVELGVARRFCDGIRLRVSTEALSKSLTPGQQVIRAVHEELVGVLGGETLKLSYASRPPTVVLMAGLQGSGKTTNSAKLARWWKQQGRNPLLVGADLQRPAAVEQLRILGEQAGVTVFSEPTDPVRCAQAGLEEARRLGRDICIIDTAGRLTIDAELMEQIRDISAATQPHYTFLVIDAMIGQDAVATAKAFHDALELRRRHPHQARRRRTRRRRALGQGRRRQAHRVRQHGRATRGLRPLPSRPHGRPDSRHGRHAQPHRAGRAHHGHRRGGEERQPPHAGAVHAGGLPLAAAPGQEDGLARRPHAPHARHVQGHARGGERDRRRRGGQGRGDRLLHDARPSATTPR